MKLGKAVILPLAVAALVGVGTGAVFASTSPGSSTAGGSAPAAAPPTSPAPGASSAPVAPYLQHVLDGLVSKGTITSSQEQAILDAWVAQRAELRAEREQLRAFLADGVLTADELAKLPADSPLQQLKPLMKNGQMTVAELRSLGRGILRDLGMGGQGRRGQGMGGVRGWAGGSGAPTPSASPTTGG